MIFGFLGACGPRMPSGPPPEYEDPPRPSWLGDGGTPPPAAPAAAGPESVQSPGLAPAPDAGSR
jgi:hypothetical protein